MDVLLPIAHGCPRCSSPSLGVSCLSAVLQLVPDEGEGEGQGEGQDEHRKAKGEKRKWKGRIGKMRAKSYLKRFHTLSSCRRVAMARRNSQLINENEDRTIVALTGKVIDNAKIVEAGIARTLTMSESCRLIPKALRGRFEQEIRRDSITIQRVFDGQQFSTNIFRIC